MIYELLICIILIAIFSIYTLNHLSQETISIARASVHIQNLQKELHTATYTYYLSKKELNTHELQSILQKYILKDKMFTFTLHNSYFILEIGKKKLKMDIVKMPTGNLSMTCNPTQYLCRKIYNRKLQK